MIDVIRDPAAMTALSRRWKREGLSLGLVPTMGYLHEGHLSLLRESVASCERTVVSIFVNPTQFAPGEDFEAYPRDEQRDLDFAEDVGADVAFCPDAEAMYPPGSVTTVTVGGGLTGRLCGMTRGSGHFRGVTTVVAKLFNIVQPDRAFFGQKDAQQAVVIQRMAGDLNFPVEMVVMPIVREPDGLAMSSRNVYLSPDERERALCLKRALEAAAKAASEGETQAMELMRVMAEVVAEEGEDVVVDYLAVVDPVTLEDLDEVGDMALLAGAIYVGRTRLIDNVVIAAELATR